VLYEAARTFGDNPLESALRTVAERLRLELHLDSVVIDVVDEGGAGATQVSAGDSEVDTILHATHLAPFRILGRDPARLEQKTRSPIRWIRAIPPSAPAAERPSDSRVHVVPIIGRGRRLGSLLLLLGRRTGFSESENRLLAGVAEQLAQNIDRSRLHDQATATEVLRRTDEVKTALLNAVSHHLRTPLASIIASAGSIRQRDVAWTETEVGEFAETIEQEARRLDRIVGNLLDLSRIQGGSIRAQKEWHDLGALLDDVLSRLRATTANHRVVVDVPDDLPPVPLDYVQIDQVVSNLIENAVKHTPYGTEVTVRASSTGSEVRVEVLDRGPGFAVAALPHVFEPFYRADGRSSAQGTGLGLAVARGLIEAHEGRIWAENPRGAGACVAFTLPLGTDPRDRGFVARAG
jgi:two-component system sensor histidine kinase KdpD